MILAEILPNPTLQETALWCSILGALGGFLFFVVKMIIACLELRDRVTGRKHSTAITPQPLEVREHQGLATERDCLQRYQSTEKEISELKRMRERDEQIDSRHRKSIYDKIDEVKDGLGQKIEDMPSKIVAMLKNAKGILE